MRYLLDTNTVSYAYRQQGNCLAQMAATADTDIALCSVLYFELEFGLALAKANPAAPRSARALTIFLNELRARYVCLDLTQEAAIQAGRLRAKLKLAGTPIGPYDLWFAALAITHKLTLVTHNTAEFARVPGLKVVDWYG